MIVEGREINGQHIYIDTDTNEIIKQFLNEDKDKEYIKWCTEHRYVEDLQINNLEK